MVFTCRSTFFDAEKLFNGGGWIWMPMPQTFPGASKWCHLWIHSSMRGMCRKSYLNAFFDSYWFSQRATIVATLSKRKNDDFRTNVSWVICRGMMSFPKSGSKKIRNLVKNPGAFLKSAFVVLFCFFATLALSSKKMAESIVFEHLPNGTYYEINFVICRL